MGCNCGQRREIGSQMVSSFKRGDYTSLASQGRAMAQSLGHDAASLMRVKSPTSVSASPRPQGQSAQK